MFLESNLMDLALILNNAKRYHSIDEANTKSAIIIPILQVLKWNVNSPFEVVCEYTLETGKVDYALKIDDNIKVLIEVKKMDENLSNYESQIRKYAVDKNIYLFVLTNGIRWQFFTWLKEGIGIFKFYDLNIRTYNANDIANELNNILSKKSILLNISSNYIKNIIARDLNKFALYEAITQVWNNILEEPHPLLCNLIIEEVNKSFQQSAKTNDVEKILSDYNIEFKKIRYIITNGIIGKTGDEKLEKLKKNILRLVVLRGTKELTLREVMIRVSRFMDKKVLNQYLTLLSEIGFIKLDGRKITVITTID